MFSLDVNLIAAFFSMMTFAAASVTYSVFAAKMSVVWMNAFKAVISLLAFAVAASVTGELAVFPSFEAFVYLFLGGFIGLNIGDFFLLKAFVRMGAARTLMIFAFQPALMAVLAFLFFGQTLDSAQFFAVGCLMACVFVISFEKFRLSGRWELWGPIFAFVGVALDAAGVVMTRVAYELDSSLGVLSASFYRCFGAAVGFFIFSQFYRIHFARRFKRLSTKGRVAIIASSILGTFISLWLYMIAIEQGHLAKVAAIVGVGPLFSAAFEHLWQRKLPTIYFWISSLFFVAGFSLLFLNW